MKRPFLIGLVVLAVLASGCSSFAKSPVASPTATATSDLNQSVASLGSITLTATGVGSLMATNETGLSFNQTGTLITLVVQEGDEVEVGTVLARLQVDLSEAELEVQRSGAEMAVIQASQELNDLQVNAELEAARALVRLEEAQLALEDAEDNGPALAMAAQAVAEAKANVEDAEMQLYITQSSASTDARYTAYAALLFKQKALAEIEREVSRLENQIKNAADKTLRDRLKRQMLELNVRLTSQQLVVNEAQARLDTLGQTVDDQEIELAQAQLATTEAQLADAEHQLVQAQAGPQASTLALAQAELSEAQSAWQKLESGPDPEALALAQTALMVAEAELAQVQSMQLILEMVTPLSGKVLDIAYEEGDRIEPGQIVLTVGDMEKPSVEVFLDEADMRMVQVGSQAQFVFDVLPDQSLSGMVTQVDPALVTSWETKTGRVLVQLDDISMLGSRWLPAGLNATVDVVGDSTENAVLIPTEALQESPGGEYGVYVVQEDGQMSLQPVTIGLMDATRVEIVTGLQAGQIVVLGDPGI